MSDFRSFLKTSNTCARRSTVIKKSSKNENAVRKKISICDKSFLIIEGENHMELIEKFMYTYITFLKMNIKTSQQP